MNSIIKIFIFLIFSTHTFAKNLNEIKILSWNTMLLPAPLSISYQKQRAQEIIKAIYDHDADVVVLQEVFIESKRRLIQKKLKDKYPYQTNLGKSFNIFTILSSGVVILSKFPLSDIKKMYFKHANLLSFDRFSSKGAILATINLTKELKFQLIGTHMQSGSSKKEAKTRFKQLQEIQNHIKMHGDLSLEQFLIGDLNINQYNEIEFSQTVKQFNPKLFPILGPRLYSFGDHDISCILPLHNLYGDSPRLYDHFWGLSPHSKTNTSPTSIYHSIKSKIINLKGWIKGKQCDLSDHLPLSVTVSLK